MLKLFNNSEYQIDNSLSKKKKNVKIIKQKKEEKHKNI